jgi:hypothetical protein
MAVNITVIRDDIKKDLTNFLIGIASAGISEDVFPQLADMITKSLSPTLDVSAFSDDLIQLLKRGNDIKDGKGVDFAPLIASIQKGSPFLDATGDSVFIADTSISEPRPHNELEIDNPINKDIDGKTQITIKDENNKDFVGTEEVEGKNEENLVNITQSAATDPSTNSSIENFITTDEAAKIESAFDTFVGSASDNKGGDSVNPFVNNTLGAFRKEGTEVNSFVTEQRNNNSEISVNPSGDVDPKLSDVSSINPFVTTDTEGKDEENLVNITQESATDPSSEINIDRIEQLSSEIIEFAQKSPRRQKQLDVLIYNAIPYGITQKLFGLVNIINGLGNNGDYSSLFGEGQLGLTDITSAAFAIRRVINNIKYLSATEIGLYVGGTVNFYTLHFRRGITIKDMRITPSTGPGIPFSVGIVELKDFKSKKLRVFNDEPVKRLVEEFIPGLNQIPGLTLDESEKLFEENQINPKDFGVDLLRNGPKPIEKITQATEITMGSNNIVVDMKAAGLTKSFEQKFDNPDGTNQYTFAELTTKLRGKEDIWNIGSLYIWPITDDGDINPKYVPFQFNPTITEAGMAARYTATTILNRIGNLQSFTGTDSLTITLSTAYVPVSRDNNDSFSMKDVQLIELVYRSLILPWFSETKDQSGYKYYKPPLLKVIMGHYDKVNKSTTGIKTTNAPYSNLLTYPDDVLNNKITGNLRHFKTFIATSCSIVRQDDTPYYMEYQNDDDSYLLKDTMGYTINLNLTEVTPSYHQIFPNFRDYHDVSGGLTVSSKQI